MIKFVFDIFNYKYLSIDINQSSKIIYKKLNSINTKNIKCKKKIIKINAKKIKHFYSLNISGGNVDNNNSQDIIPLNKLQIVEHQTSTIYPRISKDENNKISNNFYFSEHQTSHYSTVRPLYPNHNRYEYAPKDSYLIIRVIDDDNIAKEEEIAKEKYNKNYFSGNLWDHFVCRILFDKNGCRRIAIIKLEDIYETETFFMGKTKIKKDHFLGTKTHWNYHDAFYPICYLGSFYPLGTYDYPPLIECKTRYLRWHFRPTEVYIKLRKDRFNDYYPKIRIYRRCPDYYLRSFNDDYMRYHYEFNPSAFRIFKTKELKEINNYRGWRKFFYIIYQFLLDVWAKIKSLIFNFRRTHFDRIRLYSNTIARHYPIGPRRRTRYSSELTNHSVFNSFKLHRETRLDLNDIYKLKIGRFCTFNYKIKNWKVEKKNFYCKLENSRRRRYKLSPDNFIKTSLNNNLLNGTRVFHNKYFNYGKYISNKLIYISRVILPNNRVNYSNNIFKSFYGSVRQFNYYHEIIKPQYCLQKSLKNISNYYKTVERKNLKKTPIYKYDTYNGYFLYKFYNKKVGAPKFAIYTKFPNEISKRDNNKILYNYPQINGKYYELIKNYPIRQLDQKGCLMYPCPFIDTNGNIFYEPKYYNWALFYPNYYPESLTINAINPQQFWLKQHFWIKKYFQKNNIAHDETIKTEKILFVDNFSNLDLESLNDYKKIFGKDSLLNDFKHYKGSIKILENYNNFYYLKPPPRSKVPCLKSQILDVYNLLQRSNQIEEYLNFECKNAIRIYNEYGKVTRNEALMMRIEDLKNDNILCQKSLKQNKKFIKIFNLNEPLRYYQDYIRNKTKKFWKFYLTFLKNDFKTYNYFEKNYLKSILEQKNIINNDIRKIKNENIYYLKTKNFLEKNLTNPNEFKFSKMNEYFNDSEILKIKNPCKHNKNEKDLIKYKEHYKNYLIKYEKYLTIKNRPN